MWKHISEKKSKIFEESERRQAKGKMKEVAGKRMSFDIRLFSLHSRLLSIHGSSPSIDPIFIGDIPRLAPKCLSEEFRDIFALILEMGTQIGSQIGRGVGCDECVCWVCVGYVCARANVCVCV